MRKSLLLWISIFVYSTAISQVGLLPFAGAKSMAMGEVGTNLTGIHSLFTNQAGIADLEYMSFMVNAERRFDLNEIRSISAGFATKMSNAGVVGISIYSTGISEYTETKVGLAYGLRLFENLALGAQFDMINTRITEFGSTNSFTAEIGVITKLNDEISIGAHLFSPITVNVIDDNDIPTNLRIGFKYQPSELVEFYGEFEKDIDFAESFKAGIDYEIIENFFLRTGIKTNPGTYSFGLGYFLKNGVGIEAAVAFHEILGASPGISIIYNRSREE